MSKEKTPVLAGAVPSFERFMSKWERLAEKNEHLAPAINIGLGFATKYYKRMDDTNAYVLAQCEYIFQVLNLNNFETISVVHPGMRVSWMKEHWEKKYFKMAENTIKKLVSHFTDLQD